ncbi:MAG: E3 binding domain-containing protein, partial [Actinomycetota bacterium]|nr:E3 binding domain-containing protein [Actinomycetota bacterium]
ITVVDVVEFAESQQGEDEKEVLASDAARRQAEELGLDLSEIEGTGSGGMITVKDVTDLAEGATEGAEQAADGAVQDAAEAVEGASDNGSGAINATNAAQRKAEELGVDLSQIEGSGAGGLITIRDVVKG